MTKTPYEQVWEFHKAFDQPRYTYPSLPDQKRRELRQELLREEYEEYKVGEEKNDLVQIADALADMTYIIYGTGIEYGLPMDEIFAEVHRSNMSKLDPVTGKPVYREDGKVMKPATYSKADLASIIASHQDEQCREFRPEGVHDPRSEVLNEAVGDACCGCGGCAEDQDYASDVADVADVADGQKALSDIEYNPLSIMDDFFIQTGVKMPDPERIAVYVSVGELPSGRAKAHLQSVKAEFLADAKAQGDRARYYFVPTRGDSYISRI